jgi:transposase
MPDTAEKTSTRDQVEALMDQGLTTKQISEKLNKTLATVYVHIKKVQQARGEYVNRGRGRPPKAEKPGEAPKAESKARPRPPVAKSKPAAKATKTKTAVKTPAQPVNLTNGHAEGIEAIRAQIKHQIKVRVDEIRELERMLNG